MMGHGTSVCGVVAALWVGGCAYVVPNFDIPNGPGGAPTVQSISNRITCELADLIETHDGIKSALLIGDIDVALQLNLTVNDTGGLSPTLAYISGPFSYGLSGTLSQSREQNFTQQFYYSLRDLRREVELAKRQNIPLACRAADTNLAGELGLRKTVELAYTSQHVAWNTSLSDQGAFGGYVNFVVTKNGMTGPMWTLVNFTGPGNLVTFSEINTDKLTFAFARGANAGTSFAISGKQRAQNLIDTITLNQLSTTLSNGIRLVR